MIGEIGDPYLQKSINPGSKTAEPLVILLVFRENTTLVVPGEEWYKWERKTDAANK